MIAVMSSQIARLLEPLSPRPMTFSEGAAIFRVGDPVRLVHLVSSGTIHLLRHHANGEPLLLQRARSGSILAEASVFSDRYHCDAVAITATETFAVAQKALRERIGADGAFAEAWVRHLGGEVQSARLQAEIMSIKTVAGRLDAWIAWRNCLPPKGEWGALAAEIGVSPEALYREMARRRQQAARDGRVA